ncbi:uncharacterized protein [Aegilops tauschii subsp. strangulata]|uniref:uncharacterized protein n=1 Tax=Aegilops tauschii subsp. strangulata TaxID=200361 RepID=UPI003CC8A1F5
MLALLETEEGYTEADYMFYMKEEGKGAAGMQVIDSEDSVEEMLDYYAEQKVLNITVIKANEPNPGEFNRSNIVEEQVPISNVGDSNIISIDEAGVLFPIVVEDTVEELYAVPIAVVEPGEESAYINTQQSMNLKKAKGKEKLQEDVGPSDDEVFVDLNCCEDCSEEEDEIIEKEDEIIEEEEHDIGNEEEDEIIEKLKQKRKQREDPMHHFEGDTEVEEMCPEAEDSDTEPETPLPQTFKKVGKAGPTTRSHHEADIEVIPDFIPSDDSACFPGDYGISDSDDESGLPLPCGRKSQAKRARTRIWYDETKPDAHDQLCLSMCFTDVYQFRRALRNFHIRILRNFQYHRNCKDRIIVHCKERDNGCPFFMTASTIAHQKTFCIKKMKLLHTCGAHGEKTKVTVDWMARTCEQQLRDNPRAGVDAILKRAKTKYGLEVPKTKAYRARSLAIEVVEGDMKGQYTRFRDYLQAVLDTNPGSRCIVTTRELELHPSPNPRFHYMFYCLNASKEGFLNGCRPFIGIICILNYSNSLPISCT